jgi:3-oxoacyl-[acyl-carrier-protein] synthase II
LNRRVVITGIGIVSPLGTGRENFARRLFGGESGIAEISSFDTSPLPSHLGAEITEFNARDFVSVKNLRKMDRLSGMAVSSARLALDDAGINIDATNRDRIGIILGTAFGPTNVTVKVAETLIGEGPGSVNPILVPNTVLNAPSGHASIELGFRGINSTVTHFGVSAETAIAYAAAEVRRGAADVLMTGGADIISPFFFESLSRFRALSAAGSEPEGARPFDVTRNGLVAGESCGILCLEPLEQAQSRGATIYCEVSAWGMGASAAPPSDWPDNPRGIELTISRALRQAGINAEDIGIIAAAANGSKKLDRIEAETYRNLFGISNNRPLIYSVKGAVGESFSSGGINAASLALCLKNGCVPPIVGLNEPLETLAFVRNKREITDTDYALLNGISFGGTYVSLIFSRLRGTK